MPSLILFWLGCGSGDPAQLYEDGVAEQSPAVCMKIPLNDPRRLECLTTIAHQAASTMDIETAILACAAVQEGTWQDECFFQISDEGNLIGEQARRVCEKAGQFSSRCVNHAASRDVEMNLLNSGQQGQEGWA